MDAVATEPESQAPIQQFDHPQQGNERDGKAQRTAKTGARLRGVGESGIGNMQLHCACTAWEGNSPHRGDAGGFQGERYGLKASPCDAARKEAKMQTKVLPSSHD